MPDWFDTHAISVLNGLAIGSLLFILAVGLSLVFGMMDVLNLAHGAVYLVGAYVAFALTEDGATWLRFLAALAGAAVLGGLLGAALAGLTQPLGQRGHLDQALLTLGAGLVLAEGVIVLFGDDVHSVGVPPALAESVDVLGTCLPDLSARVDRGRRGARRRAVPDRGAHAAGNAHPRHRGGPADGGGARRGLSEGPVRRLRGRRRAGSAGGRARRTDLRRATRFGRERADPRAGRRGDRRVWARSAAR